MVMHVCLLLITYQDLELAHKHIMDMATLFTQKNNTVPPSCDTPHHFAPLQYPTPPFVVAPSAPSLGLPSPANNINLVSSSTPLSGMNTKPTKKAIIKTFLVETMNKVSAEEYDSLPFDKCLELSLEVFQKPTSKSDWIEEMNLLDKVEYVVNSIEEFEQLMM